MSGIKPQLRYPRIVLIFRFGLKIFESEGVALAHLLPTCSLALMTSLNHPSSLC
jgi:hypothetical protein